MVSSPGRRPISVFEAIKSNAFIAAKHRSELVVPLGMDTNNIIEVLDLRTTPHLLVAGSVTSGKRQFINSIIASLAIAYQPDEVKLLLDDVTRVELLSFSGLPHLVRPVVIQLEDTLEAIHWLDADVTERYQKMARSKVANIEAYNRENKDKMSYLVFIAYEISDLMIGKSGIVEPIICRLARSAPDAGVHIIFTTQRPEPDVITPALKDQFQVRICFSVFSIEDSMVVLDTGGAEKLQENDEMLYLTKGMTKPERLRGCSISDEEIDKLVSGWSDKN